MSEVPLKPELSSQESETKATINTKDGLGEIRILDAHFEPDTELEFALVTQKHALPVETGDTVGPGNRPMIVDDEGKLADLRSRARELNSLPEMERVKSLVTMVQETLKYFRSENQLQSLPEDRRDFARRAYLDPDPLPREPHNLSGIVEDGLGVCREFSDLYLVLANDAGMKGIYRTGSVKNQQIAGSDEWIFKAHVGEASGGFHTWTELELSDGRWIPVDPTAGFIADTPERLETFKQAYHSNAPSFMPEVSGLPEGMRVNRLGEPFSFGEATHIGPLRLSIIKDKEGKPKIPSFQGDITLSLVPKVSNVQKCEVSVKEIKPI